LVVSGEEGRGEFDIIAEVAGIDDGSLVAIEELLGSSGSALVEIYR
jgi:hypothetical protein